MAPLLDRLDRGLDKVDLLPKGSGFVDLGLVVSKQVGFEGHAEVGYRVLDNLSAYGQAFVQQAPGYGLDYGGVIGIKGTF